MKLGHLYRFPNCTIAVFPDGREMRFTVKTVDQAQEAARRLNLRLVCHENNSPEYRQRFGFAR